jgi:hypothetical protein
MDILTDYRITSLMASERELAERAEQARVMAERAERPVRQTTATGSVVCIPSNA